MAWEKRGGRSYYYRKKREGGRVRSEYVGGGPVAQLGAENDDDERQGLAPAQRVGCFSSWVVVLGFSLSHCLHWQ